MNTLCYILTEINILEQYDECNINMTVINN